MSQDRPSRPRPGGSSNQRPGGGRPGGRPSGKPGGRPGGKPGGKPGARSGGRPGGRPGGKPGGKPGARSGGRDGGRDGGGPRSKGPRTVGERREEYGGRPEPRNEAERRAAEVRKTRGPRRTERTPEHEQELIESRETEQWIDEGAVRDAAIGATERARSGDDRDRPVPVVDPEVVAEIHATLDPQRAARLSERLASASAALDRERFDEARRMVAPLVRELPKVAAVHEVNGLASYRTGRWSHAAQSLELARQLKPDPTLLPVLADCYRALKRWADVDSIWNEVKAASPPHEVMAEARIVVAGAYADRGDIAEAIKLMQPTQNAPKRVRPHHLRQWYVLADFYDRAGDTVSAVQWFKVVATHDPQFADVRDRLRSLGR